ncbi:MAG: hypothetical protein EZS28_010149 [Streblomastix strix]|uniref:Uncharacterized protein n=1 Tax=Streblomastix strix TaxID=222440 RepID=A0A5J4WI30_9EUKA|nr:MAG: hypothetical protein EZS28_010149 [Streblomastix strix]
MNESERKKNQNSQKELIGKNALDVKVALLVMKNKKRKQISQKLRERGSQKEQKHEPLGWTLATIHVTNRFQRGKTVRRASYRSYPTRKSSNRLGNAQETTEIQQSTSITDVRIRLSSRRSGNEIAAAVQIAIGITTIVRETRLDSYSKTQLTEGAHPASVDTLLIRIVDFTGAMNQDLKKLTAQQVMDLIRSKPEIMPPEWAQDLVRKPTPETQLTVVLPLLSQLQQQIPNPYAPPNPFYNQLPQQQMQGQQPPQYPFQYSGQPMQYSIQQNQFPVILPPNPFLPTMNPPQTQMNEPRPPNNQIVREQQDPIQPGQQMEQATTQAIERPRQSTASVRSVPNMLIPPIPAYPQQQTPRIPLLPYTTERNQQQRQSQRSISPTHKRADESEEDEFLDTVIPGMTMPHLPPHLSDIESTQRIWQSRGYDLVRDPSVIKHKNSKWHSKLATQKPFTFRDWKEFWSDAGFSLEQINIPHYLSKEYKSQSLHDKSRRNESIRIYEREK